MARKGSGSAAGSYKLTKEERTDKALEVTRQVMDGHKNQTNALQKSNYLDKPETREFHRIVRRKSMLDKRTCLDSVDNMKNEILEYFGLCDEYDVVPVVVGMANYLGLTTGMLYELANGTSEFAWVIKRGIDFIHELQESATLRNAINPVSFIFCAKNYFGMSDSQTITLKNGGNATEDRSASMEALQDMIDAQNKTIDETIDE